MFDKALFDMRCKAEQAQRESYGDYLFAREPDGTKFPPAYWQEQGAISSARARLNLFQLIGDREVSDAYDWE
ncbi:hypothetical protein [Rhizobium phage RHEph12]|nr:hypothetical protein [Rhizobium phage RHEph12]